MMPNITQQPLSNYSQRSNAAKRRAELARILAESIEKTQIDPNQMVSGRVVPINPIAVAMKSLAGSLANSQVSSAEDEQAKYDDERRNSLVQALSGGGNITPELLANNGASPDDLLKFAMIQKNNMSGPVYDYLNTSKGLLSIQVIL